MSERAVYGEKMMERDENRMLFKEVVLSSLTHKHIDITKLQPKERKAEGEKRKKGRTGPPRSR